MKIKFSDKFKKQYKKIKNKSTRIKINKILKRLTTEYKSKKHLKHDLKGNQTIRTKPYRIIYKVKENEIEIVSFGHRSDVYKK